MKAFFSAPQKIDLGYSINRCSISPTVLEDVLNKNGKKMVEKKPYQLGDFPDRFKTKRMCEKAVDDEPEALEYIPDHLKTGEICKGQCAENHTP